MAGAGEFGSQDRPERSKSAKRGDQMNNLLRWEEEDVIKEKRVRQSEDIKKPNEHKGSLSNDRKPKGRAGEGQDMQNLLSFEVSSPFKERQMIKEAEESMQWR